MSAWVQEGQWGPGETGVGQCFCLGPFFSSAWLLPFKSLCSLSSPGPGSACPLEGVQEPGRSHPPPTAGRAADSLGARPLRASRDQSHLAGLALCPLWLLLPVGPGVLVPPSRSPCTAAMRPPAAAPSLEHCSRSAPNCHHRCGSHRSPPALGCVPGA